MRARTVREGSVGLLILLGIGILGTLVLWLRGVSVGDQTYEAIVEFEDTVGLQIGSPVNYRGVTVGKVSAIEASTNLVAVTIKISRSDLVIPKDVLIEANESGFIGEASVDITPLTEIPSDQVAAKPTSRDCNQDLIICDGDRVPGQLGTSFIALLRASTTLSDLFSDPTFIADIRAIADNTSSAAAEASTLAEEATSLAQDMSELVKTTQDELGPLSASAQGTLGSLGQTADQLSLTVSEVNGLITANRATLVSTLDNLSATSTQLRVSSEALTPVLTNGALLQDLETLAANAAQTSANLKDLSASVNSPANLVLLQQTLESARSTFQNAQKITADLDQLTGSPEFRRNVERLVNGLSKLVSSTRQLQQQIQVAQTLEPMLQTGQTESQQAQQPTQQSPSPQPFRTASDQERAAERQLNTQ